MSYSLIIVGKSLMLNQPFMEYIKNSLKEYSLEIESISFLDKSDNNFFIKLEESIDRSDKTVIISQNKDFNFVNKVLSTLTSDKLELIDDMLIPSKALQYDKNSYIIKKSETLINVISVSENSTIPKILFEKEETFKTFNIIGIDEDSIKLLLEPLSSNYEIKLLISSLVDGWNKICAVTTKYGDLENFLKSVQSLFPDKFIAEENVVKHIVSKLELYGKKLSVVESCTGGLISSILTKHSGVSSVFDGAIVSYSNNIKRSWLGVDKTTLDTFGAVSEACVREMLEGVLNASSADYAIATSGIAGPTGGTKEKPVGTVFVGAKAKNGNTIIERLLLKGDREYIQTQSAYYAFKLLLITDKQYFFGK